MPLEIYGRRGSEIDAARGAIARDEALVGTSQQQALAEALAAYYRALRATAEDRWARQQLDLTTNMTSRVDYAASSAIDSITAVGVIDSQDDDILNFSIINGSIDLDGDGAITESDTGRYSGHAVIGGAQPSYG